MIEGPVSECADQLQFFKKRDAYLSEQYGLEISYQDYVMSEFDKMKGVGNESIIYFWFEDDLFCQANWWFLLHYLSWLKAKKYLVRSGDQSPYSFAHLSNEELLNRVEEKIEIKEAVLNDLWSYYRTHDYDRFKGIQHLLDDQYPFVSKAFEAHIARNSNGESLGRPIKTLKQIGQEIDFENFKNVFQEFQKRLPYYGYGDLQVMNMIKELKED